jgi:spoIIIJ-associated protein
MPREAIQDLVKGLLDALGASIEQIEVSAGPRTVVSVTSPDGELLIGPNGEHLRALNHLLRRLAESKPDLKEAHFTLDVSGYLESKLDVVRENAKTLAQRVRLFKSEVELPPMSSYERLVVHELFAEDPTIKTESAGEGKFRHIVLKYAESTNEGAKI